MKFDPERHHRRSIRLQGYDYSQVGAYFVTLCTEGRAYLFGEVSEGDMRLNEAGQIAEQCWLAIPDHFPHVELDEYVIMPNHVHGIIVIVDSARADVGANNYSPVPPDGERWANADSPLPSDGESRRHGFRSPSRTIGSVVRGFKIGVTKWCRQNTDVSDVWQRNYFEHIIRDEDSLHRLRHYIVDNPAKWEMDQNNIGVAREGGA